MNYEDANRISKEIRLAKCVKYNYSQHSKSDAAVEKLLGLLFKKADIVPKKNVCNFNKLPWADADNALVYGEIITAPSSLEDIEGYHFTSLSMDDLGDMTDLLEYADSEGNVSDEDLREYLFAFEDGAFDDEEDDDYSLSFERGKALVALLRCFMARTDGKPYPKDAGYEIDGYSVEEYTEIFLSDLSKMIDFPVKIVAPALMELTEFLTAYGSERTLYLYESTAIADVLGCVRSHPFVKDELICCMESIINIITNPVPNANAWIDRGVLVIMASAGPDENYISCNPSFGIAIECFEALYPVFKSKYLDKCKEGVAA